MCVCVCVPHTFDESSRDDTKQLRRPRRRRARRGCGPGAAPDPATFMGKARYCARCAFCRLAASDRAPVATLSTRRRLSVVVDDCVCVCRRRRAPAHGLRLRAGAVRIRSPKFAGVRTCCAAFWAPVAPVERPTAGVGAEGECDTSSAAFDTTTSKEKATEKENV